MTRWHFAIPGDLSLPTGGYEYARRLLAALPELTHLPLPPGFPAPSDAELHTTARLLAAVAADSVVLFDGLALGALPLWCLDALRAPMVALVHHPLCLETGLTPTAHAELRRSETLALTRAALVLTTSDSTAALLARDFAVPGELLVVAEPGTDRAPRAPRHANPPQLLSVGAISPRKGYDVLVEALAGLAELPWHLTIAGDLSRNPSAAAALQQSIDANGLTHRVTVTGAVSDAAMSALYARADIFVSAARHEGYGMAAAEALAHGLPLVATNAGALADTVPAEAALRCAPGDAAALRAALREMITGAAVRDRCAEASWQAGQRLPRWEQTAEIVAGVLGRVGVAG
jgi:glycosyltransferase involved in cell wall biosynthesis